MLYLNYVYNIEVYNATTTLQYNITNIILRKKVLLGFNSVKGNIMQSNYKIFNNSCNNNNSNSNTKI
ncbi:hypothetical protein HBI88_232610 [Parastagonospora nodorum]|nr:hypothetical protein HBI88_232610 [Parastagonospora nodorum]